MSKLKLCIICGGPSKERGISLNSARSIIDNTPNEYIEKSIIYVDQSKQFYNISIDRIYSNTPEDFDFKLNDTSLLDEHALIQYLREEVDLVFPAIHGIYGEDGTLQTLLEKNNIPFVGPNSYAASNMCSKKTANERIAECGITTMQSFYAHANTPKEKIQNFAKSSQSDANKKIVVKPSYGGSSIGVSVVHSPEEVIEEVEKILKYDSCALIEPFIYGQEFTIIMLTDKQGNPIALPPIEIAVNDEDIYSYRRKYLPTSNTNWLLPAQFPQATINRIQQEAIKLFKHLKINDFSRFDGWVTQTGEVIFSDLNPISGMEQNSFIFMASAFMGLTHQQLLMHIINCACIRHSIATNIADNNTIKNTEEKKEIVYVLCGGTNSERQVSLISGTNVWLKLMNSEHYTPVLFFLDKMQQVWQIPYPYALRHSVEQVFENCLRAQEQLDELQHYKHEFSNRIGNITQDFPLPVRMNLDTMLQQAKTHDAFIFIALHGGMAENGTLQRILDSHNLAYNGSGNETSAICMNKAKTADLVNSFDLPKVKAIKHIAFNPNEISSQQLWNNITADLGCDIVLKPISEGCSSGVARIQNSADKFTTYCNFYTSNAEYIPAGSINENIIELPDTRGPLLAQPFIETDIIKACGKELEHTKINCWIELTVGVISTHTGGLHALTPSLSVANSGILTLEEKFQGGTGINLTPPPENIVSHQQLNKIKQSVEKIANKLKIEDYARLDIFYNYSSEDILLIEVNTLPGLTQSTVLFHQAIDEGIRPIQLLEKIISLGAGKINKTHLQASKQSLCS